MCQRSQHGLEERKNRDKEATAPLCNWALSYRKEALLAVLTRRSWLERCRETILATGSLATQSTDGGTECVPGETPVDNGTEAKPANLSVTPGIRMGGWRELTPKPWPPASTWYAIEKAHFPPPPIAKHN